MNQTITIAALPLDIAWSDPEENLRMVADRMASLQTRVPDNFPDIVVLPELFSTGFIQDEVLLGEVTRRYTRFTIEELMRISNKYKVALAGSFAALIDDKIVNHGFFIEPSGDVVTYDKRHLFCLSAESRLFAAGEILPPVVRYRGWNISLIVCYDLRFPAWCRARNGQNYDLLLVPANWPQQRQYAWEHLLIARAIENQAIVVGANRSGSDDYGEYNNLTYIFDPLGRPLTMSLPHRGASDFVFAQYDMAKLKKMRMMLPVARDADKVKIEL